jgi:hypothetical protein
MATTDQTSEVRTLPTPAELEAAYHLLLNAHEAIGDVADRVFWTINNVGHPDLSEQQLTVTFEHIGSLAVFAADVKEAVGWIGETAAKLAHVAVDDLSQMQQEGGIANEPSFDENGLEYGIYDA